VLSLHGVNFSVILFDNLGMVSVHLLELLLEFTVLLDFFLVESLGFLGGGESLGLG